jgi:hypothetical protein
LTGEGHSEEEEEPFVQATVAYSAAIEDGPDDGGEEGEDEEAEREGVVDGFVAAAAAGKDEGSFVVEDVDSGEADDRSPGQDAGGIGKIDGRERDERRNDLRGEAVNAEVDEAEAEGNAGGEAPAGDGLFDLRLVEDGWRGQGIPPVRRGSWGIEKSCRKQQKDCNRGRSSPGASEVVMAAGRACAGVVWRG